MHAVRLAIAFTIDAMEYKLLNKTPSQRANFTPNIEIILNKHVIGFAFYIMVLKTI